jgi:CMP-2-keto-3-deoxyoctulosonic acid synthetase
MIASKTIIKVITNAHDEMMYMSRLPVPHSQGSEGRRFKQQVPVYGFTREALDVFSASAKTLNESFEDIEMLRFVDLGHKVKMQATTVSSISVDLPEDIGRVEAFLQAQYAAANVSDLR